MNSQWGNGGGFPQQGQQSNNNMNGMGGGFPQQQICGIQTTPFMQYNSSFMQGGNNNIQMPQYQQGAVEIYQQRQNQMQQIQGQQSNSYGGYQQTQPQGQQWGSNQQQMQGQQGYNYGGYPQTQPQGQQWGSNQQQIQGQHGYNYGGYPQQGQKFLYYIKTDMEQEVGGQLSFDVLSVNDIYYIKFLKLDTICELIAVYLKNCKLNDAFRCISELVRIIQEIYTTVGKDETGKFSSIREAIQVTLMGIGSFGSKRLTIGKYVQTVDKVNGMNVKDVAQEISDKSELQPSYMVKIAEGCKAFESAPEGNCKVLKLPDNKYIIYYIDSGYAIGDVRKRITELEKMVAEPGGYFLCNSGNWFNFIKASEGKFEKVEDIFNEDFENGEYGETILTVKTVVGFNEEQLGLIGALKNYYLNVLTDKNEIRYYYKKLAESLTNGSYVGKKITDILGEIPNKHYYKIKMNVPGNSYYCLDLGNKTHYIICPNLEGICNLIKDKIDNSKDEHDYYSVMEYIEILFKVIREAYSVSNSPDEFTYQLQEVELNEIVPVNDFVNKTLTIGELKEITVNNLCGMNLENIKEEATKGLKKASELIFKHGCYYRFTDGALQEGEDKFLGAVFVKMYTNPSNKLQYPVYIIHNALNNIFTTKKEISEIKKILGEGDKGYHYFQEYSDGNFQSSDQNIQILYPRISKILNCRPRKVEDVLNAKCFSKFDKLGVTNDDISKIQNDQDLCILNMFLQTCQGMKPVDVEPYFIRLFDVFKKNPQKINGIDDTREIIWTNLNEEIQRQRTQLMANGNPQQMQQQGQQWNNGSNQQQNDMRLCYYKIETDLQIADLGNKCVNFGDGRCVVFADLSRISKEIWSDLEKYSKKPDDTELYYTVEDYIRKLKDIIYKVYEASWIDRSKFKDKVEQIMPDNVMSQQDFVQMNIEIGKFKCSVDWIQKNEFEKIRKQIIKDNSSKEQQIVNKYYEVFVRENINSYNCLSFPDGRHLIIPNLQEYCDLINEKLNQYNPKSVETTLVYYRRAMCAIKSLIDVVREIYKAADNVSINEFEDEPSRSYSEVTEFCNFSSYALHIGQQYNFRVDYVIRTNFEDFKEKYLQSRQKKSPGKQMLEDVKFQCCFTSNALSEDNIDFLNAIDIGSGRYIIFRKFSVEDGSVSEVWNEVLEVKKIDKFETTRSKKVFEVLDNNMLYTMEDFDSTCYYDNKKLGRYSEISTLTDTQVRTLNKFNAYADNSNNFENCIRRLFNVFKGKPNPENDTEQIIWEDFIKAYKGEKGNQVKGIDLCGTGYHFFAVVGNDWKSSDVFSIVKPDQGSFEEKDYILYSHSNEEIDSNIKYIKELCGKTVLADEVKSVDSVEKYDLITKYLDDKNIFMLKNENVEKNYTLICQAAEEIESCEQDVVYILLKFIVSHEEFASGANKENIVKFINKLKDLKVISDEQVKFINEIDQGGIKYSDYVKNFESWQRQDEYQFKIIGGDASSISQESHEILGVVGNDGKQKYIIYSALTGDVKELRERIKNLEEAKNSEDYKKCSSQVEKNVFEFISNSLENVKNMYQILNADYNRGRFGNTIVTNKEASGFNEKQVDLLRKFEEKYYLSSGLPAEAIRIFYRTLIDSFRTGEYLGKDLSTILRGEGVDNVEIEWEIGQSYSFKWLAKKDQDLRLLGVGTDSLQKFIIYNKLSGRIEDLKPEIEGLQAAVKDSEGYVTCSNTAYAQQFNFISNAIKGNHIKTMNDILDADFNLGKFKSIIVTNEEAISYNKEQCGLIEKLIEDYGNMLSPDKKEKYYKALIESFRNGSYQGKTLERILGEKNCNIDDDKPKWVKNDKGYMIKIMPMCTFFDKESIDKNCKVLGFIGSDGEQKYIIHGNFSSDSTKLMQEIDDLKAMMKNSDDYLICNNKLPQWFKLINDAIAENRVENMIDILEIMPQVNCFWIETEGETKGKYEKIKCVKCEEVEDLGDGDRKIYIYYIFYKESSNVDEMRQTLSRIKEIIGDMVDDTDKFKPMGEFSDEQQKKMNEIIGTVGAVATGGNYLNTKFEVEIGGEMVEKTYKDII